MSNGLGPPFDLHYVNYVCLTTTSHVVDSEFRFTDIDDPDDQLSVQDLLTYVYPEEAGQVKADSQPSKKSINSEFRFTDLDDPDDQLSVQDLTYVYPAEKRK